MLATDVGRDSPAKAAQCLPRRCQVFSCPGCWPWTRDNGAVFSLVRPPAGVLDALVREQAGCDLSYREAGATAGTMPPGYRHDRWEIDLGAFDGGTFPRLAAAPRHWQPQRGARLPVLPPQPAPPGPTLAPVVPPPARHANRSGP